MSGHNGCSNNEHDYEVGCREERARIVAYIRMCAANNADWSGVTDKPLPPGVRTLSDRDARMFAFIADTVERREHLSWQKKQPA